MSEGNQTERKAELIIAGENVCLDEESDAWLRGWRGPHKYTCEICQSLVSTPWFWMHAKQRRIRCDKHVANQ